MRILICEDDTLTADALQAFLMNEGHTVSFVSNGQGALAHLVAPSLPLPDLIVTDLRMPCMEGEEFLELVAENKLWRNIAILVITADRSRQEHLLRRWPQVRILTKPFELSELLDTLRESRPLSLHDDKGLEEFGAE